MHNNPKNIKCGASMSNNKQVHSNKTNNEFNSTFKYIKDKINVCQHFVLKNEIILLSDCGNVLQCCRVSPIQVGSEALIEGFE